VVKWARVRGAAKVARCFHINSTAIFHIFMFSYWHIGRFSYYHRFKNTSRTNNMCSLRKLFHRTEGGIKRARNFLSGINAGKRGGVAGVAGIAGWIHINSNVIFRFFLFSYRHRFKNASHMNSMDSLKKMLHRTERV
jgi:hypothetical protein